MLIKGEIKKENVKDTDNGKEREKYEMEIAKKG